MTTTVDRAEAHRLLQARLPDHLDRLSWSADRIASHQRHALRTTLAHAIAHSRFHRERLRGLDPSTVELDDLGTLPVMTKADLMDRFDDVVTDRRVTLAGAEALLARTGDAPLALAGGGIALASGGSSGTRGVFVYGLPALADYLLGMVRPGIATIQAFGGPPPGGVPMCMVAAGSAVHATRALSAVFSGDLIQVTPVPATLPLAEIVERLNRAQPLLLQGYPAVLQALAAERRAGRLTITPMAVTGTSEPFTPGAKADLADAFGVWPADQFGSSEGLVGISTAGEDPIELATDLAIVELVDDAGRPVPAGTPSSRVLLTTVYNPLQPLIRYELTDAMVEHPPAAGNGRLRVTVQGRADDVLRWGGVTVHPHTLRSVLLGEANVREYQIVQEPNGVRVSAVATGAVDTAALAARLTAALRGAGAANETAAVSLVDDLPRHPETGKTRRVVPLPATARSPSG